MNKRIFHIMLLIILVGSFILPFLAVPVHATLTQVGKITITNNGSSDITDTAIRVTITNPNFFSNVDETHLRIQDSSNNDIPFWIEKWDSTNQEAIIWVKVSVSAGASIDLYCYHDDTLSSSLSNGENVFLFFDDFEGTDIDTSKWTVVGTVSVDNSIATIQGASTNSKIYTEAPNEFTYPKTLFAKVDETGADSDGFIGYGFGGACFTIRSTGAKIELSSVQKSRSRFSSEVLIGIYWSSLTSATFFKDYNVKIDTVTDSSSTADTRTLTFASSSGGTLKVDWVGVTNGYEPSVISVSYTDLTSGATNPVWTITAVDTKRYDPDTDDYVSTTTFTSGETCYVYVTVRRDGDLGDLTIKIKDSNSNIIDDATITEQDMNDLGILQNVGDTTTVTLNFNVPTVSESTSFTYTVEVWDNVNNEIDDSTTFTITVEPEPNPYISITDVTADKTGSIEAGSQVTFTVTLENTGGASGDYNLELYDYNNNLIETQSGTLNAGETTTHTFTITVPSTEGDYTYTFKAYDTTTSQYDGAYQYTITVYEPTTSSAHFTGSVSPSTLNLVTSQNFDITVYVSNDGGETGLVEIRVKDHNNNIVASVQGYVSAQSTVGFQINDLTAPQYAGTYTWTIELFNVDTSTVDGTLTITLNVEQQEGYETVTFTFDFTDSNNNLPSDVTSIDYGIAVYYESGDEAVFYKISKDILKSSECLSFSVDFSASTYYKVVAYVLYYKNEEIRDGKLFTSSTSASNYLYGYTYISYYSTEQKSLTWKPLVDGNVENNPPVNPQTPEFSNIYLRIKLTDSNGEKILPDSEVVDSIEIYVKYRSTEKVFSSDLSSFSDYTLEEFVYVIKGITLSGNLEGYLKIYLKNGETITYSFSKTDITCDSLIQEITINAITSDFTKCTITVNVYDSEGNPVSAYIYLMDASHNILRQVQGSSTTFSVVNWITYIVNVSAEVIDFSAEQVLTPDYLASNPSITLNFAPDSAVLPDTVYYSFRLYFTDSSQQSILNLQSISSLQTGFSVYDRNGQLIYSWSGVDDSVYFTYEATKDEMPIYVIATITFTLYDSEVKITKKIVPVSPTGTYYFFDEPVREHMLTICAYSKDFKPLNASITISVDVSNKGYLHSIYVLNQHTIAEGNQKIQLYLPNFLGYIITGEFQGDYASKRINVRNDWQVEYLIFNFVKQNVEIDVSLQDNDLFYPSNIKEISEYKASVVLTIGSETFTFTKINQDTFTINITSLRNNYGLVQATIEVYITYICENNTIQYYMPYYVKIYGSYAYVRPLEKIKLKPITITFKITDESGVPIAGVNVVATSTPYDEIMSRTTYYDIIITKTTDYNGIVSFTLPRFTKFNFQASGEMIGDQELNIAYNTEDNVLITWKVHYSYLATFIYVKLVDAEGNDIIGLDYITDLTLEITYVSDDGSVKTKTVNLKVNGEYVAYTESERYPPFFVTIIERPKQGSVINIVLTYAGSIFGSTFSFQKTSTLPASYGTVLFYPFANDKLGEKTFTIVNKGDSPILVTVKCDKAENSMWAFAEGKTVFSDYVQDYVTLTLPSMFTYKAYYTLNNVSQEMVLNENTVLRIKTTEEVPGTTALNLLLQPTTIGFLVALGIAVYIGREIGNNGILIIFVIMTVIFSLVGLIHKWVGALVIIIALAFIIWNITKNFGFGGNEI